MRHLFAACFIIVAFYVLAFSLSQPRLTVDAAPPPPLPAQPHPDQFIIDGFGNLAQYNPLDGKVKNTKTVSYRLLLMPGCTAGIIPNAMQRVEAEAFGKLGQFRLVRNDVSFDFTVRINCGSDQIRVCGSVNIFCLGRGFPYIDDVDLSDVLSYYESATQLAIPLHEIIGHALATWDEQYCKGTETSGICQGLPLFANAPGWHDIMNTGPESRHGLEQIELERWSRTMYNVLPEPVECSFLGYDPCTDTTVYPGGWRQTRGDEWIDPNGVIEFTSCNADRLRWSPPISRWVTQGSGFFDPSSGIWALTPACP